MSDCQACEDGRLYTGPRPYQVDQLVCRQCQRSPAIQMRVLLDHCRARGDDFEVAWEFAWARIRWPHDTPHRLQWKAILEQPKTVKVWRDCYENVPASAGQKHLPHLQLVAA